MLFKTLKIFIYAFTACAVIAVLSAAEDKPADAKKPEPVKKASKDLALRDNDLSNKRLDSIKAIIDNYSKAGEDLSDADVVKSIMKEVAKTIILEPKVQADVRSLKEIAEDVREIVAKRFPDKYENIKRNAEKEAESKFVMHNILDKVKVIYKKGPNYYTMQGTFYSFGGGSIRINERYIALFDLADEYRVKFDKTFNEQKKKEYIDNAVQRYFEKKNQFSNEVFQQLKEAQSDENEKHGYIYAWKQWRTARNVAEILISTEITNLRDPEYAKDRGKHKEPAKEETAATPAEGTDKSAAAKTEEKPVVETKEKADESVYTNGSGLCYDDVIKKVEQRLRDISNTYSGVDADQGYRMALWGFSREEVRTVLSKEFPDIISAGATDVIKIADPSSIERRVELFYIANTLVSVSVWYELPDSGSFLKLSNSLIEKYGNADAPEETPKKDAKDKAAKDKDKAKDSKEPEKKDGAAKDAAAKDGDAKDKPKEPAKKKDAKAEKDKAQTKEQRPDKYRWTGKNTVVTLIMKDPEHTTESSEVKLIKECPGLVKTLSEEEKKKKAEDAKERLKSLGIPIKRNSDD